MIARYTNYLGAAILGGSISSTALAQDENATRFEIAFQVDARHDSNIANASADRAIARGLEQEDQRLGVATTVAFERAFGPNSIYADAYVGYDFYSENDQLDSERISATAGASFELAFCDFQPEISFARQQSILGSELVSIDDTGSVDNVQTVQSYGATLSCGPEVGLRAEGGVSYERGDNDNALRQTADYETFTYKTGVGYQHPSLGTISVFASHQDTEFENRNLVGVEDSFQARRFGARLERDIGARISGSAEAFYLTTESAVSSDSDFDGIGFGVELKALLTEQLQARVNLLRDIQTALNNDALYTETSSYGVDLEYAASPRLTLNTAYVYNDRDFVFSDNVAPLPINLLETDRIHTVTASANYDATERLSFTLYGGYEDRDANGDFFDYNGGFVGLTARFKLGRKR